MSVGEKDEDSRRIDVELFIIHPTMTSSEITAALGLEAHSSRFVGAQRMTPKGTLLKGVYPDTRWRHSIRYEAKGQWFADKVTILVDQLVAHKAFFHRLRETGGKTEIIVQFLGDGYFGDNIPLETLMRMGELKLDFGIEVFTVPQSDS